MLSPAAVIFWTTGHATAPFPPTASERYTTRPMSFLIGTDEAGYGPNLGPLVVSASVWRMDCGDEGDGDLYRRLGRVVSTSPDDEENGRVAIADSKRLYKPGQGLAQLERGLLAALEALGRRPQRWREAWQALAPDALPALDAEPWNSRYCEPLPIDAAEDGVRKAAGRLAEEMHARQVALLDMQCTAVFAGPFNRLIERHGNKSTALSLTTLGLLRRLIERISQQMDAPNDEPIHVVCDKHGGRDRYRDLLQHVFPDPLVIVVAEGRQQSRYRWQADGRTIEISFRVGGEAYLPAALASMASKYLRELAMRALNDFWCTRVAGLRPTAGYPVDARRFKKEIALVQAELGIADAQLWRCR